MFKELFTKTATKQVKKSGVRWLDKKVAGALEKSAGKCVKCRKAKRKGQSLFCRKCLNKIWSF